MRLRCLGPHTVALLAGHIVHRLMVTGGRQVRYARTPSHRRAALLRHCGGYRHGEDKGYKKDDTHSLEYLPG